MVQNKDKKMTTIAVSLETREALAQLGGKDSTFDSIITKLLKERK